MARTVRAQGHQLLELLQVEPELSSSERARDRIIRPGGTAQGKEGVGEGSGGKARFSGAPVKGQQVEREVWARVGGGQRGPAQYPTLLQIWLSSPPPPSSQAHGPTACGCPRGPAGPAQEPRSALRDPGDSHNFHIPTSPHSVPSDHSVLTRTSHIEGGLRRSPGLGLDSLWTLPYSSLSPHPHGWVHFQLEPPSGTCSYVHMQQSPAESLPFPAGQGPVGPGGAFSLTPPHARTSMMSARVPLSGTQRFSRDAQQQICLALAGG